MFFVDFIGYFFYQFLQIYKYAVIIYVVINMLMSFNIINNHNRLVSMLHDFLYRLIEPILNLIRRFVPTFGSIDISPIILIILLEATQYVIVKYGLF